MSPNETELYRFTPDLPGKTEDCGNNNLSLSHLIPLLLFVLSLPVNSHLDNQKNKKRKKNLKTAVDQNLPEARS